MKRSFAMARLTYPASYRAALKRRRIAILRRQPTMITAPVGVVRTTSAYRRSIPGSAEKKYFDTAFTPADMSTTGLIFSLNRIEQGTSNIQRIGNKLTIKNINLRLIPYLTSSTNNVAGSVFRIMLLVDKQANGTEPVRSDILVGSAGDVTSFRNLNNDERFDVLYDKFITLNHNMEETTGGDSDIAKGQCKKVSKKCNYVINYSSTTNDITAIRSNDVVLALFCDDSGGRLKGSCRVKFLDQ